MDKPDTIIDALRIFLSACPYLDELTDIHIDWIQENDGNNGIYPGGESKVSEYMCDSVVWNYSAFIQLCKFSPEDAQRIANAGIVEKINTWVNSFSRTGFQLPERCDFISIEPGNGALVDVSEDGQLGIYRIQLTLIYERTGNKQ